MPIYSPPATLTTVPALPVALSFTPSVIATNANPHHSSLGTISAPRTYRTRHIASDNASAIQLVYANYYANTYGENGTGTTSIVKASIEDAAGHLIPVWFSGARNGSIDSGGFIISDPVGVEVTAGNAFFVRTCLNPGSVANMSFGMGGYRLGTTNSNGEGVNTTTDVTDSGTTTAGDGTSYSPTAILGIPNASPVAVSVAMVGDSIASGTGDATPLPNLGGFLWRAINETIGYVRLHQGGEKTTDFQGNRRQIRVELSHLCTHAVVYYGINDLTSGTSLATIQANLLEIWTALTRRKLRVWACTLVPHTSSTDAWETMANQSIPNGAQETVRTGLNDWIRTTPSPLQGYFEVADTVEVNSSGVTTRNGGYFPAPNAHADSGTSSGTNSSTTLNDTSKTWTVNQFQNMSIYITGGTASGAIQQIASNTATALTLKSGSSWSVTPDATSTYRIIDAYSLDGTHPTTKSHILMAAAVSVAKLTL